MYLIKRILLRNLNGVGVILGEPYQTIDEARLALARKVMAFYRPMLNYVHLTQENYRQIEENVNGFDSAGLYYFNHNNNDVYLVITDQEVNEGLGIHEWIGYRHYIDIEVINDIDE